MNAIGIDEFEVEMGRRFLRVTGVTHPAQQPSGFDPGTGDNTGGDPPSLAVVGARRVVRHVQILRLPAVVVPHHTEQQRSGFKWDRPVQLTYRTVPDAAATTGVPFFARISWP